MTNQEPLIVAEEVLITALHQAIAILQKAVDDGSQERSVYLTLAGLYEKDGDQCKAMELLEKGLSIPATIALSGGPCGKCTPRGFPSTQKGKKWGGHCVPC